MMNQVPSRPALLNFRAWLSLMIAGCLLCFPATSQATVYFWDATTGNGTLDYGNGTISTTGSNWWSASGTYSGWTNSTSDTMQIGSASAVAGMSYTGGSTAPSFTMTLSGSISLGQITVSANLSSGNTVTISDGGNSANTLSFSGASNITNNSVNALIINAQIASAGGSTLSTAGTGTIILTASNGYTGGTTITGGTGASGGGILQIGNGGTTGSLGAGTVSFQLNGTQSLASTLLFDLAAPATVSNAINLNSANAVGGIIQQSGSNTLSMTGGVSLNNSSAALTYNIAKTGQAVDTQVSGVISGGGSIIKSGSGTLLFSGSNTYTGATTINAGTLTVGASGDLGSGSYAGNISNSSVFIYNSTAAQTLSGVISGTGSLVQQGSGTLKLSGTNTYSGATTVNGGNLTLAGFTSGGAAQGTLANSNVTINSGAAFQFGTAADFGNATTGSMPTPVVIAKNVTMNGGTFIVTPGNGSGITSANSATAVSLSGTLTLAAGLNIEELNGATSRYTGLTAASLLRIAGSTLLVASPNTVGTSTPGTITSQDLLFTSNPTLTNTVLAGVFISQASATLDATTIATYNATNGVASGGNTSYGTSGALANNGNPIATVTTSNFAGTASGSVNSLRMDGSLDTGGFTLTVNSGVILARGNVSITSGTLALGAEGQIYVSNNTSAQNVNVAHTMTIGSVITGTKGLTFTGGFEGQGTLILNGAETYTGTTTINTGTLQVNGSLAAGSAVSVGTAASLTGTGTVNGTVTVSAGGETSPGAGSAPGVLTSDLAYNSGATANFNVSSGSSATPAAHLSGLYYSQMIVTGTPGAVNLGIGTGVTLKLTLSTADYTTLLVSKTSSYNALNGNTLLDNYFVFNLGSGLATGRFSTLDLDVNGVDSTGTIYYAGANDRFAADGVGNTVGDVFVNGQEYALSYTGSFASNSTTGGNDIVLTAIPEPGTWGMILCGFGMLIGIQRLRKRRIS
ncbi:MAG: autotransporter-associated beta strand repeat-containing protein [Chthoniobacteraceae bacterium]